MYKCFCRNRIYKYVSVNRASIVSTYLSCLYWTKEVLASWTNCLHVHKHLQFTRNDINNIHVHVARFDNNGLKSAVLQKLREADGMSRCRPFSEG